MVARWHKVPDCWANSNEILLYHLAIHQLGSCWSLRPEFSPEWSWMNLAGQTVEHASHTISQAQTCTKPVKYACFQSIYVLFFLLSIWTILYAVNVGKRTIYGAWWYLNHGFRRMLWIALDCFGTDVSGVPPGSQDQKHPPPSSVMVGGKKPELNGQKMWKMRFTSSPCFHPHHFENAASSESRTLNPHGLVAHRNFQLLALVPQWDFFMG